MKGLSGKKSIALRDRRRGRPERHRDRSREVQADPLQPAVERGEVLAQTTAPSRSARGASTARSRSPSSTAASASRRRTSTVIFDEFRQIDTATSRAYGGTGLGLSLVKKFVELQRGSVSVESTLGEGSTFTFTLPLRFAGDGDSESDRGAGRRRHSAGRARARRRGRGGSVRHDQRVPAVRGLRADPRALRRRRAEARARDASARDHARSRAAGHGGMAGPQGAESRRGDVRHPGDHRVDARQPRARDRNRRGRLLREAGRVAAPPAAPRGDHAARRRASARACSSSTTISTCTRCSSRS
jgi:hypothetical protein